MCPLNGRTRYVAPNIAGAAPAFHVKRPACLALRPDAYRDWAFHVKRCAANERIPRHRSESAREPDPAPHAAALDGSGPAGIGGGVTVPELLGRFGLDDSAAPALAVLLDRLADPAAPTAVHDQAEAVNVHIADSLAGLELPELRGARVVADLGAGAGLPGLVLAAALRRTHVTLIEATRRKCEFLLATAAAMALDNVAVVCARAEEWTDGVGKCEVVCARALAALPVLCEYAAPLLRLDGVLVAWKGTISDAEQRDGAAAAHHLGLTLERVLSVTPYPGSKQRTLHVLRKTAPTPAGYPRRPGIATKRPLSATNLR
jgi:16S rRNA (guanine527-N7)-methyltransferase